MEYCIFDQLDQNLVIYLQCPFLHHEYESLSPSENSLKCSDDIFRKKRIPARHVRRICTTFSILLPGEIDSNCKGGHLVRLLLHRKSLFLVAYIHSLSKRALPNGRCITQRCVIGNGLKFPPTGKSQCSQPKNLFF